jgi:hypothetical protein
VPRVRADVDYIDADSELPWVSPDSYSSSAFMRFPKLLARTGIPVTDLLQRVLVDSPANELPFGNLGDSRELFIGCDSASLTPVFNCFEIQQTQIFALFPVAVGFLPDVDGRPVRNSVCALQQSSRV